MAEGWARYLLDDGCEILLPALEAHADRILKASKVMSEFGIDISQQESIRGQMVEMLEMGRLLHR